MKPPDFRVCNEKELRRYVAWHLDREGISTVLVGGAVVSIYSRGAYRSGDLDMITDEVSVEGRTLRLLSPTDCIKDRLASFIHWKSRDSYNQALLVGRNQRGKIDMREIARWCEGEGVPDVYQKFALELSETP